MRGPFRLTFATILALACGFVFAADPVAQESTAFRDSFPDAVSYPATVVDSRLEGPIADSIRKVEAGGFGISPSYVHTQTYVSQPHPLLAAVLPHASFTRTVVDVPPEFHMTYEHVSVAGKVYRMDRLNHLLLGAGFSFDSAEISTIAKIAVLFATFGYTFGASGNLAFGREPTDSTPGDGFPAITFLSLKREEKHYSGAVGQGVRVQCIIDGIRVNPYVALDGADKWGRRQVDRVFGGGLNLMTWPVVPLPPPSGK